MKMVITITVSTILLAIALFIFNHLIRKNKYLAFGIFAFLPIVLTPLWISIFSGSVFVWVKIYSLIVGALWILLLRFTSIKNQRWGYWVMWSLLLVNILEAIITDAFANNFLNYLNLISGLLLVLTIDPVTKVYIDKKSKSKDLLWPSLSFSWLVGYSIWNLTFVYLNFPEIVLRHVVLLAIPLVVAYYFRGSWIQTRAFTLAAYFMFAFTFPDFVSGFNTPNIHLELVGVVLASLSVAYMVALAIIEHNSKNNLMKIISSNLSFKKSK